MQDRSTLEINAYLHNLIIASLEYYRSQQNGILRGLKAGRFDSKSFGTEDVITQNIYSTEETLRIANVVWSSPGEWQNYCCTDLTCVLNEREQQRLATSVRRFAQWCSDQQMSIHSDLLHLAKMVEVSIKLTELDREFVSRKIADLGDHPELRMIAEGETHHDE